MRTWQLAVVRIIAETIWLIKLYERMQWRKRHIQHLLEKLEIT